MKTQHVGSNFDEFLVEEGLLEDAKATAVMRVIAFQIAQEMKRRRISKQEMARRMGTRYRTVERLLDPENRTMRLSTLERAASAVGKKLVVAMV